MFVFLGSFVCLFVSPFREALISQVHVPNACLAPPNLKPKPPNPKPTQFLHNLNDFCFLLVLPGLVVRFYPKNREF